MAVLKLPLDRGDVDSLGDLRVGFTMADLDGAKWVGYLADGRGRIAVVGTRLYQVTDPLASEPILLGRTADGVHHVAWIVDSLNFDTGSEPTAQFVPLTKIAVHLTDDESLLASQSVALARWHVANRFCSRCGSAVRMSESGWANTCTSCDVTEYPRMDPVVIVRITDDADRLLLAHNTAWEPGRMSLPAGYVEAGETPRRAIEREMWEEVGVRVEDPQYLGSQVWPGPRSLMLAFGVSVVGGAATPTVDGVEIDHATFFTRAELTEAIRSGAVTGPGPSSIAAAVIEGWLGEPMPRTPEE